MEQLEDIDEDNGSGPSTGLIDNLRLQHLSRSRGRKINVLFLNTFDSFGGFLVVERALLRHLNRNQFNVYFAGSGSCSTFQEFVGVDGVVWQGYNFGRPFRTGNNRLAKLGGAVRNVYPMGISLGKLVRLVRRCQIDVVHTTEKPKDCLYGMLLSRLAGCNHLLHMHMVYYPGMGRMVMNALKMASAVVTVSEYARQTFIEKAGLAPERLHTILNCADLLRFRPRIEGADIRREFSIPAEGPLLAVVGRLFPAKGQSDLIEAIPVIRQQFPDIHCLIVGDDERMAIPGRMSYRLQLERLCEELGVEKNVTFTGFRNDIPEILSAADVAVVPSWEEPFGLGTVEAMACGKPVVATRAGGIPEIVRDGMDGILVETKSPENLAGAIIRLLRNPSEMQQMGRAGRTHVETLFREDRMVQDFEMLYKQLTSLQEPILKPA